MVYNGAIVCCHMPMEEGEREGGRRMRGKWGREEEKRKD